MRFPQIAPLAICATLAFAALTAARSAPLPQGLPNAASSSGFGINVHWWYPPKQDEVDKINEAGFKFVRLDINWNRVEKTQGVYDFSAYDPDIDIMARDGIKPLIILAYGNKMYDDGLSPHTDAGRAGFAAFAGAAATRYKGHGILWEIWNEPNSNRFWQPHANADDYAALAIAAAKAIRAGDPTGLILAPTSSRFPWDFYRTVFQHGLLHYIDAVSVHPYRQSEPEDAVGDFGRLRRLIGAYTAPGDPIRPIISSEWGYASNDGGVSTDIQARYQAREWLSNMQAGIDASVWYDLRNDGNTNPKDPEQNFGMVGVDLSPKTAFTLAKTLLHALDGATFDHSLPTKSATDHSMLFSNQGALMVVNWSSDPSSTPDSQTPSVRKVTAGDPDYADLTRSALIKYGAGVLVATPDDAASLPVTIANDTNANATVSVSVGPLTKEVKVAKGATTTVDFSIPVAIAADGLEQSLPVSAIWNGKPVADLSPGTLNAAYPISLSSAPTSASQIGVDITSLTGQSFNGSLRITNDGKTTTTSVSASAGETVRSMVADNVQDSTVIEAVDSTGRVLSRLGPLQFIPVPGFPTTVGSKGNFSILRSGKSPPSLWQVPTAQATVAGAPVGSFLEAPYGDVADWQTSEVGPMRSIAIPVNASAVTFWVDFASQPGVSECGRFIDSTGQNFQAAYPYSDKAGWRVETMPLEGEMWHWGGAKDGQIRGPLQLGSLYLIATHDKIEGTGTVRAAAPYFAIGQPVTPDAPH